MNRDEQVMSILKSHYDSLSDTLKEMTRAVASYNLFINNLEVYDKIMKEIKEKEHGTSE